MRTSWTIIVAAVVGAVALSVLLIPSDRSAAVAFAQGPSMDQQTEMAAIDRTMRSYYDAFSHGDAAASAQQFSAPSMFMTPQGAASRATIAQIETSFAAAIRDLKSTAIHTVRGWSRTRSYWARPPRSLDLSSCATRPTAPRWEPLASHTFFAKPMANGRYLF
jgi:hypothetical protein